jgi:cystathionine beta-lyase
MDCNFDRYIDRRGTECAKWQRYGDGVLPLWVADMDFASPEPVIRALRERVEHGVFGYPAEPPELRDVIVERMRRLYGWQVSPEWLVFLPGVVTGFNLACQALAEPGDGVLIQTPVYGPIIRAAEYARLSCDEMVLTLESDGRYTVDFERMEAAITPRTRLFLLCNPHNPVGRVFTRDELAHMAEICARHDLVICSDEIHCELLFSGSRHLPIATLSPEIEARTITLMAPSKTFNIAGLHCSVAIVPDDSLRRRMQSARRGLVGGVTIMGYTAALAAYREGQPWLDALLCYLEDNRNLVVDYVNKHLPGIRMACPEGTYLAWLDCRQAAIEGNAHEFFVREARVALNDGREFGRPGEGFVRLNFGCCRDMLVEALERMRGALESL